jgi:superfamily II DNA/RNA helicase
LTTFTDFGLNDAILRALTDEKYLTPTAIQYVHRVGRTARAGADGIAISFCDADEVALVRDIEKLIRMSIPASEQRTHRSRSEERPAKAGNERAASGGNTKQRRRRRGGASRKQWRRDHSPDNAAALGSPAILNRHAPSRWNAAAQAPRRTSQSEGF